MKKVIIYCAWGYGDKARYSLDETQYEIVAFSDSNSSHWGRLRGGIPVISPDNIAEYVDGVDFVIIAYADYADTIKRDLIINRSVPEEKIITFLPDMEGIHWEEERVVMLRKCIEILKERDISGSMAEVGVYRGDFAKLMNRYLPNKTLYLFDTFEGFDATRDQVNEADLNVFKDTSVDIVLDKMSHREKCIVKKGYFPDTAAGIEDMFCLVSLDTDLYQPILNGLRYFWPKMVQGGYIFVHDFGSWYCPGVKKAVYEFLETTPAPMIPISDKYASVVLAK